MKIFLLGFMGVGKTFWGQAIANKFELTQFDLDLLITQQTNKSISQIFAEEGENFFREKERECLRQFAEKENFVLSCGGGTPCFFDNMNFINQHGISIWLNEDEALIFDRLKNEKSKRPLIQNMDDESLRTFIKNKNLERKKFYEQASIIVNGGEDVLKKISCYEK